MKTEPIDPLHGPKIALAGRVECMDPHNSTIADGVLYIDRGLIADIRTKENPPPAGFESTAVVDTGGTLFPGLIELHNHLSYNALPLWKVPRAFRNRDQWGNTKEYHDLVTGPMTVVGKTPRLLPSLVRYVECKALVAGVTTSQGIQLASNSSVRSYYRGIVRNVENTDDEDLPEALTRVDDVEARNIQKFYARLLRSHCLLLHLSEGIDDRARGHFLSLQMQEHQWAISKQLVGIHCTGLHDDDFVTMQKFGGSVVWSPMSNLLLYGQTSRVEAARRYDVKMAIGSDWSPTGSKNLLCELKIARIYSQEHGGFMSDRDIVRAVTCEAAALTGWQNAVGVLGKGKRADILVIRGTNGDACSSLIDATEKDVLLVMINGVARYGEPSLMARVSPRGEKITVGGEPRTLFLEQRSQDPRVAAVSFKGARRTLREAFLNLPALAAELRTSGVRSARMRTRGMPIPLEWTLALDEVEETGLELRPRLHAGGQRRRVRAISRVGGGQVRNVHIDPLTVVDDSAYIDLLQQQVNLPAYVKTGIKKYY